MESPKQLKIKQKQQRGGFLAILLGTLGDSLLGNCSLNKGITRNKDGVARAGGGIKKRKDF